MALDDRRDDGKPEPGARLPAAPSALRAPEALEQLDRPAGSEARTSCTASAASAATSTGIRTGSRSSSIRASASRSSTSTPILAGLAPMRRDRRGGGVRGPPAGLEFDVSRDYR